MFQRVSIAYPKNWTETKQLLGSLEARWNLSMKITDKRQRMKEWLNIARDANFFYELSKDKERTAQDAVNYVKHNEPFVKLIVETVNLNFYKRNLRAIEQWMRTKKIPIRKW